MALGGSAVTLTNIYSRSRLSASARPVIGIIRDATKVQRRQAPAPRKRPEARRRHTIGFVKHTSIAADKGQPSNYKTSIVDLMKLLGLDASLANRTTLAKELGYTGDTNDSATMNIWLHKQVMESLATQGA